MKGFTKKAGLGCLTAALALSVGLGVSVCVSAQQEQDVFSEHGLTVTMDPGAAIRRQVGDGVANGIRFLAVVPDAAYSAMEALEEGGVSVSYGMLIASAEDVAEYGALTAENVFGDNAKYEPIEEGGAEPAGKGAVHHFEYETLPTGEDYTHPATDRVIAGELTDFSDDELADELVGVAYAVYEDGSGAQYLFAKDNNNSVSMTYAAQVAVEKQLDSAENAFAATYIDKVPSADRQTTFTVEYLFEGENGAYAADPAVPAKTVSAELGEKTNLNSIPDSFDEKPFFVPDEEKNAEHVPQTVYANGKRVVQAYYRKAEVTAIAAEVKQDAVFSSYMSVDAVAELFTVTATYEDGSEAPVADFTIAAAEEDEELLITGRKDGALDGKQFLPFSGNVDFVVTAEGIAPSAFTTTCTVTITADETSATVQDFNDADDVLVADNINGTVMYSENVKLGSEGGAAVLAANTSIYGDGYIYLRQDISAVDALYYWLYFDSTSLKDAAGVYGKDNLPVITDTVITHTGFRNWTVTAQTALKWDSWILVKAVKSDENTETSRITVNVYNRSNTWGFGNEEKGSGFAYNVYLDDITTAEPQVESISAKVTGSVAPRTFVDALHNYVEVTATYSNGVTTYAAATITVDPSDEGLLQKSPAGGNSIYQTRHAMPLTGSVTCNVAFGGKTQQIEIPVTSGDATVVHGFENQDVKAIDNINATASVSSAQAHSGSYAALLQVTGQYNSVRLYPQIDPDGAKDLYYWLYFDSTTFKDKSGTYNSEKLPTILVKSLDLVGRPDVGTVTTEVLEGELKWDTWILVKATYASGYTLDTYGGIKLRAYQGEGNGFEGNGGKNYTYYAYIDDISTVDPRSAA